MNDTTTGRYLREMIEKSSVPCVITDPNLPDNPIVALNAAFIELVGYEPREIMGQNCRFLSGALTEPQARRTLREAIAEGRPAVVEITNYRRDGSSFRNAVTIAPLFDGNGHIEFFMGSQMRIEADRLGERQRSSRDLIAGLSRRQVDVLAQMAHGKRYAEIAEGLHITEKTVKMHRAALVKRLGCRTSAEAIRIAIEAGL